MLEVLFSSKVRAKLLTHLFRHPEKQVYARRLARATGEYYNAVWRELNNLEQVGLLHVEQDGNRKVYCLNSDFPIYEELHRIILKTSGLGGVLREAIEGQSNLRWAFVHGSMATGSIDAFSDIDLMLIGEVALLPFSETINELEDQLGRDINYVILTEEELAQKLSQDDVFLKSVFSRPMVMLVGDEDALQQAVAAASH